jgi:hypothetical protein
MPEVGGSYLLTLDVPGGDNSTSAAVDVTDPIGGTSSPPVGAVGTSWEAIYGPITAVGWFVARWTVTGAGEGVKSGRFYVVPTPEGFGVWPPSLADLKLDMGDRDDQDDANDDKMSMVLDAAIARVRKIKRSSYDVAAEEQSGLVLPPPTADIVLGTLRLAARWHSRRSTWDNLAAAGDGQVIVPGYDSDIERLLEVGRFTRPQDAFA